MSEYPDFEGLINYLAELERDWRGWHGTREWMSLEGDLSLTATHTGGRLEFRVVLKRAPDWEVHVEMTIGAGEDLSSAVRAARSALS